MMTSRSRAGALALVLVAVALTMAACSSKAASPTTSANTGSTGSTGSTGNTGTAAPAPASTSPPTTAALGSNLTGMGATVAQMKKVHGLDGGSGAVKVCGAANSCFGPGLTNDESGKTFQFVDVSVDGGSVDGYQQNFVPNTSLATAEGEILQWMPSDATMSALTVDTNGGSCAMFNITSPTLGTIFSAPKIGDPQGVVGVELSYTDSNLNISYNPNNIQDASMSVAPSVPTAAC